MHIKVKHHDFHSSFTLTGVVGFNTYFGTTKSFHDAGTDELFSILQRCKLLWPHFLPCLHACGVESSGSQGAPDPLLSNCDGCLQMLLLGTCLS